MIMSKSGGRKKGPDKVIVEVMARRGIDPKTVYHKSRPKFNPKNKKSIIGSRRYVLVRGFGNFFKPPCKHWWRSPFSWCIIDLRQQRIRYRYTQQCHQCEAYCKPYFKENDTKEKMAEYACKIYLGERTRFPDMGRPSAAGRGHHDVARCEMCKLFGYCMKLTGSNSESENCSDDSVK